METWKIFIGGSILYFVGRFLYKIAIPWILDRIGFMADKFVARIMRTKGG